MRMMPLRTPPIVSSLWIFWASLFLLVLPLSQGFVSVPHPKKLPCSFVSVPHPKKLPCGTIPQQSTLLFASNNCEGDVSTRWSHSDIEWRLRPPEGTSRLDRLKIKLGANILRLESKIKGGGLPPVLLPRGGRALLEAYHKEPGRRKKKIARFGFTTARGPSTAEIDATIKDIYNIDPPPLSASIAAIIYMFVEPEYRSRDVGALALEAISAIQYVQAIDFTILAADDNGSGGLVRWYEEHGYSRAPLLQSTLGSPDKQNGIAMISPVKIKAEFFDQCVIKWW